MAKNTQPAKVIRKAHETKDTVTLRLELSEPFDWEPGQFIMVQAIISGESVRRAYSVSSSPTRSNYLEITIRQTETPTMSRYLNEIAEGEMLDIRGPYGRFIWTEEKSNTAFFLGAGSGITPFRAFLQYLEDKELDNQIKLLYTCAHGDNVIFEEELKELTDKLPSVEYELSLTRESAESYPGIRKGRIDKEYLAKEIKGFEGGNFYMCGTPGFIKAMMTTLQDLGIDKDQLHREQWG